MKLTFFKSMLAATFALLAITLFTSCKKSSDTARSTTTGFTWSVGGVNYTADTDTAFASFNTIIASKDAAIPASSKFFEIDLSALTVGAYTLTSSGSDQINYVTSTGVVTSQSGTLNITANAGNKLSGNFSTTLTGGVGMTGTFTDVLIKP